MTPISTRLSRVASLAPDESRFRGLRRVTRQLILVLTVGILAAWVWERGMLQSLPAWLAAAETVLDAAALGSLFLGALVRILPPTRRFRRHAGGIEALLGVISIAQWLSGGDHRLSILAGQSVHLMSSTGARVLRERLVARVEQGAARMAPLSFALVIAIGTVALALPLASQSGSPTSVIDALFTSTSAVCVTGLVVKDTPTHFGSFGHWTILSLIQIGGLGTMTLSLSLIVIFQRPSGRQREALMQVMSVSRHADVFGMVRFVAVVTVIVEVIGWAALVVFPGPVSPAGGRVFLALFHSVSAFCNAGFSLWSDSLERASVPAVLVLSVLIIAGGLGFAILRDLQEAFMPGLRRSFPPPPGSTEELAHRAARPRLKGWRGLSLHTRLGLFTTGLLIAAGMLLFFFGEYDNTMQEHSLGLKLVHAYFQSVTTRTAGFNTLPFARFAPALIFGACVLMFIGACPGGTGGGIKTTTAASLVLSLRSLLSSRGRLEAFGRSLPDTLFQRAVAITLAYLGTLCLGVFLLLVAEARPAMQLLFEATSALGTVGLSTGITPELGTEAKLILIGLMFAGRVGPLTLALSVGERRHAGRHEYPSGDVLVG